MEFADGNCARWQSHYAKGPAQIEITNTICFNPDGTLRELFTRTAGVQFSDYRYFGDKRIAWILTVWPQPVAEVKATINILEALQENTEMFAIPNDTDFNARTRFVSVPEGALQVDAASQSSINWPVVHNFPASGAVTIDLTLDRAGNVREMGTVVSRNILMIHHVSHGVTIQPPDLLHYRRTRKRLTRMAHQQLQQRKFLRAQIDLRPCPCTPSVIRSSSRSFTCKTARPARFPRRTTARIRAASSATSKGLATKSSAPR